jgi:hypothetical protein
MLVLLMGVIYEVHHSDGRRCHVVYIPGLMRLDTGVIAILRPFLRNLKSLNISIIDGRNLLCTPLKWAQVA